MKKKVLVPIANGTEEFEAIGIIDTFRRAEMEVTVASVQSMEIVAAQGVKIVADKLISDCQNEEFDLIALPGGLQGAKYLRDNKILTELLKKQVANGKLYAAICASPVIILQHHGLLKNKNATVHPALANQLINKKAIEQRVVVDGNCITSRGPGTILEFAIKLIEIMSGKEKAEKIAKPMLVNKSF